MLRVLRGQIRAFREVTEGTDDLKADEYDLAGYGERTRHKPDPPRRPAPA